MHERYVLVTPAKNEEAYIEKTIQAVLSQTILPQKWVIVSDGSTDRTDELVAEYAQKYDFITLLRASDSGDQSARNFGSKVSAFRAGYHLIVDTPHNFVGNLDADVTFDPDYFEQILRRFQVNLRLGLAGGLIFELNDGKYLPQQMSLMSVAGAVQLFRRQAYESFGGYLPIKGGGVDAAAEIMTRMHGWEVQSFPEIRVLHHRRVSTGGKSVLHTRFRQGVTNYLLGYHPVFHIASCLRRLNESPYALGGIARLGGYGWASLKRYKRVVPDEVVKFLRAEQMTRMTSPINWRAQNKTAKPVTGARS